MMSNPFASQPNCVVFVANRGFDLTRSRLLLIESFLKKDWKVVVVTADDSDAELLRSLGVIIEPLLFYRGGLSLISDIKALISLYRIYQRYQPQLIHLFHIKPLIFGNLIAQLMPNSVVVSNIEGLGYTLVSGGILQLLASLGYRLTVSRSDCVIFLNPDDQKFFIERQWLPLEKTRLIISPGIDTIQFSPILHTNQDQFNIFMATRLLWQKGVREFVEAAIIVKQKYPHVCFQLGGAWDDIHPDAVDPDWLNQVVREGIIDFLGYVEDMTGQLQETDIFVLPSYYREGVPRVLLEAASCEIPVVTTDWIGCREAVVDGETGYLIPPRNSQALANALLSIISFSPEERKKMGRRSRQRVKELFDIPVVTELYLNVYREFDLQV